MAEWPKASQPPAAGRAPDNPKHYKVFKNSSERQSAGFETVAGIAAVFSSWKDYLSCTTPKTSRMKTGIRSWTDTTKPLVVDVTGRKFPRSLTATVETK